VCARACNHAGHARQCLRLLTVEANHPALKVSFARNFAEGARPLLKGADTQYLSEARGPGTGTSRECPCRTVRREEPPI
jgi:hypothetical protein